MSIAIEYSKTSDGRGSNFTTFDSRARQTDLKWLEDKFSRSKKGVIRGFHGDGHTHKLISCVYGKVKLVTYDIDTGEKNKYYLDGDDPDRIVTVLVPPRTLNAHQCLSDECVFHYKWDQYYTGPDTQWSVKFDDEEIDPRWNLGMTTVVSERDMGAPTLQEFKRIIAHAGSVDSKSELSEYVSGFEEGFIS